MNIKKIGIRVIATILLTSSIAAAENKYYEPAYNKFCGTNTDRIIGAAFLPVFLAGEPMMDLYYILTGKFKRIGSTLHYWYQGVTGPDCIIEISEIQKAFSSSLKNEFKALSESEANELGITYNELYVYNESISTINLIRKEILDSLIQSSVEISTQWKVRLDKYQVPQQAQKVLTLVARKKLETYINIKNLKSNLRSLNNEAIFESFFNTFHSFYFEVGIYELTASASCYESFPKDKRKRAFELYTNLVKNYNLFINVRKSLSTLSIEEDESLTEAARTVAQAKDYFKSIASLSWNQLIKDHAEFEDLVNEANNTVCKR